MSSALAKLFPVLLVLYSSVCPFEIKEVCHVLLVYEVCAAPVCLGSFLIDCLEPCLSLLLHTGSSVSVQLFTS